MQILPTKRFLKPQKTLKDSPKRVDTVTVKLFPQESDYYH